MDQALIKAVVKGIVPEMRNAINAAQQPLLARIEALESRPIEKGEPGQNGADGKDGAAGADGPPGEKGEKGEAGETGPRGEKGDPGERGEPGEKGERGDIGPIGERGEKGDAGERGEKGDPGRDGRDAADLSVIKEIAAEQARQFVGEFAKSLKWSTDDGGRTQALSWEIDGAAGKQEIKTALPLDRGVWKEAEYLAGDSVSLGGQLWIAQCDTKAKPGESQEWRLSVKRGRDGKDFRPDGDRPQPMLRLK